MKEMTMPQIRSSEDKQLLRALELLSAPGSDSDGKAICRTVLPAFHLRVGLAYRGLGRLPVSCAVLSRLDLQPRGDYCAPHFYKPVQINRRQVLCLQA